MKEIKTKEAKIYSDMLKNSYTKEEEKLIIPIGICEDKEPVYMNMETIHGLFIGGTTGSGKSVLIDNIICFLIEKNSSNDIKFLLMDPKKIELFEYNGLDYLYNSNKKTIRSPKKALDAMLNILKEMSKRVNLLVKNNVKNIVSYNKKAEKKLPHIFIVIDESTDIMKYSDSRKIIEQILDSGRPLGIHVIFATNSYLKDYYDTKFIHHFKYRISFDMASKEQAKYMEIKGCDLLKESGTCLIKCPGDKLYKLRTASPSISETLINKLSRQ